MDQQPRRCWGWGGRATWMGGSGGMGAGNPESAARMVFLTHLGDEPAQQEPERWRPSLAVTNGRGINAGVQG